SMVGATHNHTPIEENAAIYQELVAVFINLSRSLTENYEQIADFQRQHIAENKTQ
ncbi:gluconate kinase, partial [Staphylococcus aureus]|nr:gluconate kinase [Staphylococcus aureus]